MADENTEKVMHNGYGTKDRLDANADAPMSMLADDGLVVHDLGGNRGIDSLEAVIERLSKAVLSISAA